MTHEILCRHQRHRTDCGHYYHPNMEREGEEACRKHHCCQHCPDGICINKRAEMHYKKRVLPKPEVKK